MAYNGFMNIDGIPGESSDSAHKNWIELIAFQHEVSQPAGSATSRIGGRTGARVDVREFVITKLIDKSTPNLFFYCCSGKHITQITAELCSTINQKSHTYLRWKFKDCIIASTKPSGVANEQIFTRPIEQIGINFGEVELSYTPVDHMGTVQATIMHTWSLEQNRGT